MFETTTKVYSASEAGKSITDGIRQFAPCDEVDKCLAETKGNGMAILSVKIDKKLCAISLVNVKEFPYQIKWELVNPELSKEMKKQMEICRSYEYNKYTKIMQHNRNKSKEG